MASSQRTRTGACRLLVACALSVTVTLTSAQPEIHLPAITNGWIKPVAPDAPEITVEEVERCMGQDLTMQRRVGEFKQQQAVLKAESEELDKTDAGLKRNAEAVAARKAALQEQSGRYKAEEAELDQRAASIQKGKGSARSAQDVRAVNAQVAAFNADLARHNKWRQALMKEQESVHQAIDGHNAAVAQANQRIAGFKGRNDALRSQVAELTAHSEQFKANCGGERRLRRADE